MTIITHVVLNLLQSYKPIKGLRQQEKWLQAWTITDILEKTFKVLPGNSDNFII